jgi:hypothetical protein
MREGVFDFVRLGLACHGGAIVSIAAAGFFQSK